MQLAAIISIAVFIAALFTNCMLASKLGRISQKASVKAVANGGLNPSLWAFGIWGIIYTAFIIGYIMWLPGSLQTPLPWCLSLAWVANVTWLLAGCYDQWQMAFVLILAYLCFALCSLKHLKLDDAYGLSSHAFGILSVTTASLSVWLVAASLLNAQIVIPRHAYIINFFAVPVLLSVGAFLIYKSSDLSNYPGCMSCGVVLTLIWICVALEQKNTPTLADEPKQTMSDIVQFYINQIQTTLDKAIHSANF